MFAKDSKAKQTKKILSVHSTPSRTSTFENEIIRTCEGTGLDCGAENIIEDEGIIADSSNTASTVNTLSLPPEIFLESYERCEICGSDLGYSCTCQNPRFNE